MGRGGIKLEKLREKKLKTALKDPKDGKPRPNRKESILLFWTQNEKHALGKFELK